MSTNSIYTHTSHQKDPCKMMRQPTQHALSSAMALNHQTQGKWFSESLLEKESVAALLLIAREELGGSRVNHAFIVCCTVPLWDCCMQPPLLIYMWRYHIAPFNCTLALSKTPVEHGEWLHQLSQQRELLISANFPLKPKV